jgi:hypothetical protein
LKNANIFRWYRSGWGRYVTADPIGNVFFNVPNRDARNVHLNHLYAYGEGNPETNADPLGLTNCCNKAFDDCWGKCIENWRLDWKTPPVFSALPKRFLPPFRVPYPEQPLTNVLSSVGRLLGGRSSAVGSALRGAGRIISPVATTLTVCEGFYDLTIIGECATACKLNPCTDLAWQ